MIAENQKLREEMKAKDEEPRKFLREVLTELKNIRQKQDLTQKDGWKTQDGRMTKKYHARLCTPCLARNCFRHSAVLSLPAVLLRKVCIGKRVRPQLQRKKNRIHVPSTCMVSILISFVLFFFFFRHCPGAGVLHLEIDIVDYLSNRKRFPCLHSLI